jgi:hypothetical protein
VIELRISVLNVTAAKAPAAIPTSDNQIAPASFEPP